MPGIYVFFCSIILIIQCFNNVNSDKIELRMPNSRPERNDQYLCHSVKLGEKTGTFITGFEPHGQMDTAHHMLVYGCSEPGSDKPVWDCGEMGSSMDTKQTGPTCKSGSTIVYAWAMDAPPFHLPKDTSFMVGKDTPIKYLVLQIHYKDATKFLKSASVTDQSGFTLDTQSTPTSKLAGMYLMGTGGSIGPHSLTTLDTACTYNGNAVLHPIAYRVHTHKLGKVVSGFRIRDGKWTELGRKSPQKPQMFYNTSNPEITIKPGDALAARCVMKNDGSKTVRIGTTQADEMCNFYLMYWVQAADKSQLNDKANAQCWTDNAWDEVFDEANIPLESMIVPDTNELLSEIDAMNEFINEQLAPGMIPSWNDPKLGAPSSYQGWDDDVMDMDMD